MAKSFPSVCSAICEFCSFNWLHRLLNNHQLETHIPSGTLIRFRNSRDGTFRDSAVQAFVHVCTKTPTPCNPQELAGGYVSSKMLLKLEAVHHLVAHHSSAYFAFLEHPVNFRNRTSYYATLAKLVFTEDNHHKIKAFLAPLGPIGGLSGVQESVDAMEAMTALSLHGLNGGVVKQEP